MWRTESTCVFGHTDVTLAGSFSVMNYINVVLTLAIYKQSSGPVPERKKLWDMS